MTLAAIAGLASGISVYAYIRILKPIFFGDSEPQAQLPAAAPSQRLGAYALIAVLSFFAAFSAFLYNSGVTAVQKIY
jgi:NADH:ubiquinone oxidoreductase subunit 2 (subunit N)